jgi:FkbM family methyltransferase
MSVSSIRSALKWILPKSLRDVLRGVLHYFQRLLRWPIVLWQVRGGTWRDQWVLLKSALAAPLTSLRGLQKWQDPLLVQDAVVEVSRVGVFSLRANTDDLWHVLPWRENAIAELLRSTLGPGDVFIDAGANIGVYTVLASRLVGPSGSVISIEMMPDTARRLESHIRMNRLDNVTVVRNALSNLAGQDVIATVQPGKHGQATIATDSACFGLGDKIRVQTTTLDAITPRITHARLMKIDVEGAEHIALQGAEALLKKLDVVVFESWAWARGDCDPVDAILVKAGFNLSQLDGNNWLATRAARS